MKPLTLNVKIKDLSYPLRLVEGGTFNMGSNEREREQPIHTVTLPDFYIGQYLVTQDVYEAVMGDNPAWSKGNRRPVENVSWEDAKDFIAALEKTNNIQAFKQQKGLQDYAFRLPSEAEWEYAARGGQHSQGYEYCGSDELSQVGWYGKNSGRETKPVGLLLPNELGLFDMSGNVYEWCEDDFHSNYQDAPDDGRAWIDAPDRAAFRVLRGGDDFLRSVRCRPAIRYLYHPGLRLDSLGFRLVFAPSQ